MTREPYATHAEPCPWCGTRHGGLRFREASPGLWRVECPNCGAIGPHPPSGQQSYTAAIARWNNGDQHP